jgi:hypothetical protein
MPGSAVVFFPSVPCLNSAYSWSMCSFEGFSGSRLTASCALTNRSAAAAPANPRIGTSERARGKRERSATAAMFCFFRVLLCSEP